MTNLVQQAGIKLDVTASSPEEAVHIAGKLLVELGATTVLHDQFVAGLVNAKLVVLIAI